MDDATSFVGAVPALYDRCMGPFFFEPYAEDLATRLAAVAPSKLLELACGTGIVTRRLRDRLPASCAILATDLNEAMLAQARPKFRPGEAIEWRTADATHLPMSDGAHDAVVCQFGVMFFPDKPRSFREVARVLSPGGAFVFNVWDALENNPLPKFANERIVGFFAQDPPDFYQVPFGFHDAAAISAMLADAGFQDVQVTRVSKAAVSPSALDLAKGLVEGNPIIAQILARPHPPILELTESVAGAIREGFGDAPVQSTLSALVCSARKPR